MSLFIHSLSHTHAHSSFLLTGGELGTFAHNIFDSKLTFLILTSTKKVHDVFHYLL